ncbi:hypothetical protein T440DRAFT_165522 [Plenodomus tracheiphilus IPT5]|uniref:Uncharacterized protein n=1 Tax=Plenodomus tracheiphilus IPT5 TaxID=1408161 RepID=A0A6A7BN45_9PLEO|nr:hypothetical protein T440DRAFT_165522 [Plenodomus tracheiphilus IPT5]
MPVSSKRHDLPANTGWSHTNAAQPMRHHTHLTIHDLHLGSLNLSSAVSLACLLFLSHLSNTLHKLPALDHNPDPHPLTHINSTHPRTHKSTNSRTMCKNLLQVYACGHDKSVCITPCPHAIATGEQFGAEHESHGAGLLRSSSIVSSIAPSIHHGGETTTTGPAVTWGGVVAPLMERSHVPAFRLRVAGSGGEKSAELGLSHHTRTSNTHNNTTPSARTTTPTSQLADRLPSPTTAMLSRPLSTIPIPSNTITNTTTTSNSPESLYPAPNYCTHPHPHHLPQSHRPCLKCFVTGEEWEHERQRWRNRYRSEHTGVGEGDVERECGLERLRGEFGV